MPNSRPPSRPRPGALALPLLYRGRFSRFAFTYGRTGPHRPGDEPLVSEPSAIDFAFTANPRATIQRASGRTEMRSIQPGSGGSVGEPFAWVDVPDPSEFVEVRPDAAFRREVATDLKRPDLADLGERLGHGEPWLFALASRFRAHALGGRAVSDLEGEAIVSTALRNVMVALGARAPARMRHGLDARRLARVIEHIDAHLDRALSGAELADVAAVSRFHFTRMFALAVGVAPHAFVTARRMARARDLLTNGVPAARAAPTVGYAPAHQFRRAFRAQFGPGGR